jgi:hypothetical protein
VREIGWFVSVCIVESLSCGVVGSGCSSISTLVQLLSLAVVERLLLFRSSDDSTMLVLVQLFIKCAYIGVLTLQHWFESVPLKL